jgi:aspartate/methionine/tyrosine aminotransferase
MSAGSEAARAEALAIPLRGVDVPPFYAAVIGKQLFQMQRAGHAVIAMNFGQPIAGTPPRALAAAAAALQGSPSLYLESRELAERISRHYRETYALDVAPERIVLTNGASAALVAVFAGVFAPGDRVGFGCPAYPAYRNVLTQLARSPVEIDCAADVGFKLTPRALKATPGLRGLVVSSPANPTGAMLDREELAALAAECRAQSIRLISDEIYHGISFGKPAVSALEVEPEAIVVNSFSKLYRLAGWRLGWLVVPPALVPRLSAYVVNFFLTAPTISQFAALAVFDDATELARSVEDYRVNRDLLLPALETMGISGITPPEGAFFLYADVGRFTSDSLGFCQRLLAETGLALAPGVDFDTRNGGRFVRISLAVTLDEAKRAIELLRSWLARQPKV